MNFLSQFSGKTGDVLILTGVRIFTILVGFLTTSLLSHGLNLATYGVYVQGNLLISVLTSVSILGFTDGVNYFYNGENNPILRKKYIDTLFGVQLFIGCFLAVGIFVFQDYIYLYFKSSEIKNFLLYLCFRPLLNNYLPMIQVLYVSTGKIKHIAIRNFFVSLIKVASVCATIYLTHSIGIIFLVLLITDIVSIWYFIFALFRDGFSLQPWRIDCMLVRKVLIFCMPMGIYILVTSLCRECDKLIIARMGNTEELAIYTNSSLPLPVDIIISAVLTVIIPLITRLYHNYDLKKAASIFRSYLSIGYTTTFVLSASCIIFSNEIIQFLYGTKYLMGHSVFVIYMIVDMLKFANISAILSISGKTGTLMVISIALLLLNIPLSIAGYNLMGISGPAIVTVLITLVSVILLMYLGARELRTSLLRLIDFRHASFFVVQLLVVGIVCYFIKNWMLCAGCHPYIVVLCLGSIFCGIMLLLNFSTLKRRFAIINQMRK